MNSRGGFPGFGSLGKAIDRYHLYRDDLIVRTTTVKLLIIAKRPPWPIHYGDRLHCYELVRRLDRRHEVLLIAQHPGDDTNTQTGSGSPRASAPPFDFACCVAKDGRLYSDQADPATEGFVADRIDRYFGIDMGFARDVVRFAGEWEPDVVIGMNYHSLPLLARIRNVPTVCDLLDDETLHALLELLHGGSGSTWERFKCTLATLLFQRRYIRQVDAVTVLSEADRRFCKLHTGHRQIRCIPHGVDCEYYAPQASPPDENRIIFWGSLTFGPNIGAIRFFAEKVWPIVLQRQPHLRWTIAGRGHAPALDHVKELPGVDWLGYVHDLRPWIAKSAVVVVPMLSGAGIKNKIMEAWAMGKAVLCTSRGLGGLPGKHGENVWIANSPKKLAQGLSILIQDRQLRGRIERAARLTAEQECSWDRAALELERLCTEVLLQRPPRFDVQLDRPGKSHEDTKIVPIHQEQA